MSSWLQPAIALIVAALGIRFVSPGLWWKLSSELVPVWSIIAAAVLFRLGRGLPNFEVATLSAAEVRNLATAYRTVAQNTAWILVVLVLAICWGLLPTVWCDLPLMSFTHSISVFAFIGMWLTTLAAIRAVVLVRGDLSLIRLQAKLLEQQIKAQHVTTNKLRRDHGRKTKPMSTPPGYGGLASHDQD